MGELLVVVEHRLGQVNDITYQMLNKAGDLCKNLSLNLTALVIAGREEVFIPQVAERADRVLCIENDDLKDFNGEIYTEIIKLIIDKEKPLMTLIGHTPWGVDIAPSLSIKTGYPFASDCVDIFTEDNKLKVIRQIYGGKLLSRVGLRESDGYIITVRPGAFSGDNVGQHQGRIEKRGLDDYVPSSRKEFIKFVDTGAGEVDISQADLLVSIGRGIGEKDNIEVMKDLADKLGGTISCSRPVVDKGWLPKYHQVGTSGKTVKPKVYLACGISGAFQHVAGISGAGTVIAINKDKKAPIFRIADYGVIDDVFKVVEALKSIL